MRALLTFLFCVAAAACASTGSRSARNTSERPGRCDGDEYVEVSNRGQNDVEIYAAWGGEVMSTNLGVFLATGARGTSRIALNGTAVAGKAAGFTAQYNGQRVYNVTFRRGCDPRR